MKNDSLNSQTDLILPQQTAEGGAVMQEMIELKSELDKLISSLSGVLAARTLLNANDEITEIHVLSDLTQSPKQLVRDIQSAIIAAFGLEIDEKLISVAQVNSSMAAPAAVPAARLAIRKIMISLDSSNMETTVVLGQGDNIFEGSSKSPLSGRNRVFSAANACLVAVRNCLGQTSSVTLLDLQRNRVANNDCFTVAISYADASSEKILYGIAPIDSPEFEVRAVVMAVLSALNRIMSRPRKR
ncbi:MAG TPA: hypothetical protein DD640_03660 [Clostridiales bacterium]|nr:hypothetical protein [Clostridiales bacterium]